MTIGAALSDSAADFCHSQHFLLLDSDLKAHAESLLAYWADAAGDEPTALTVKESMLSVAHGDLPLAPRRRFPELLQAFLDHLPSTGRFPLASSWSTVVEGAVDGYLAAFRDDGSVRGKTVRKPVAGGGRNEPCPCGSGRKFKKCCGRG